jgi:GNAT superfamily N-acetyltransferase
MMDMNEVLALFDQEQRINIEYPGVRKERRPHVIRYVSETGGPHFILYSDLTGADIEAVIAEEQAYFEPLGKVEWKVFGHDQPADLPHLLAAHGFQVADEPDAVMVMDLDEQGPLLGFEPEGDVSVRRLEEPAQLKDLIEIEETVWGQMPWLFNLLGSHMSVPGYLSAHIVTVAGQPACAGWMNFHANGIFADLWGGSTLAEHRGKGLYTALLATRAQEAAERGYRFLIVDAGPMSRPILARRGFRLLTTARECKWGQEVSAPAT